jgi:hypothetical protein
MFLNPMLGKARANAVGGCGYRRYRHGFYRREYRRCVPAFRFAEIECRQFAGLQIVIGGGGVRNATLLRCLQDRAGFGTVCGHEDFGIDSSAKEPLAFALLAHETLRGRPGNVPSATGARRAVVLGKIVPG